MANPIHVKLEFDEAVHAKRTLLYCEKDFLTLIKNLDRYAKIRKEKEKVNSLLNRELRKLELEISFIMKMMPEPEDKYDRLAVKIENKGTIKETKALSWKGKTIEQELQEINERLKKLS